LSDAEVITTALTAMLFFGVKVQVITTGSGIPVEIAFLPGSAHDTRAFNVLSLDLPPGSEVYGDLNFRLNVLCKLTKTPLNLLHY
jgi:hypothetical protein